MVIGHSVLKYKEWNRSNEDWADVKFVLNAKLPKETSQTASNLNKATGKPEVYYQDKKERTQKRDM